ncbi:GGDEF domain-containing protein [Umezawaea beigongshangensis]|uniref:GGDEF domain-containing protein n=1 Tax=Umezawaea beigongshangensis TaxID=2780383 RepID=UPI0018F1E363|nr:GGDEF domain-containing protein [Umezawaea beigongshangensis]
MRLSLTDRTAPRSGSPRSPRRWELWSLRPAAVAYFLLAEGLVVVVAVLLVVRSDSPSAADWLRFGALAAAVTVHLVVTRRAEESRRNASPGPHIDLTSVWTFAAAVALPAGPAVLVVLWVRVLIQPIARRQPFRYVFSSASILCSTLLAWGVVRLSPAPLGGGGSVLADLGLALTLAVAALLYWFVQVVTIAFALRTVTPHSRLTEFLGSREDNVLEVATLGAGAVLGALVTTHWVGPLLLVGPIVLIGSLLGRAAERREHLERLLREERKLHQRLAEDAHTDHRTGLLNAAGFADRAGRLVERCRLDGRPVTVLAIDLDHFKRINDTWGHPAGNAVLTEVGRVLRERLRPGDVAGREGGEEFVVVLADTPLARGAVIAERLREELAALRVRTTDKHRNTVTLLGRGLSRQGGRPDARAISASIGVAVVPDHGDSLAAAQHSADAALYRAKESGRNRVQVAEGDVASRQVPAPRQVRPRTSRSA